jgi:hypothetical protein
MTRHKGGGGKLNRSEIIQARLGPKLKFGSELLAKKEHCTLSTLVGIALEKYSENYPIKVHKKVHPTQEMTLKDLVELVWSPDEGVRFLKTALTIPTMLTHEEEDFFHYLINIQYFWAFYEVTYNDTNGNFLRSEWRRYHHIDGLIAEHINEYWYAIKDNDVPLKQKIPKEMGKKIGTPPGFENDVIIIEEPIKKIFNVDGLFPIDHETIWRENISSLIKSEYETVDTPQGKQVKAKIIYPTSEEQMEMVERIYQEHIKWQSNSHE